MSVPPASGFPLDYPLNATDHIFIDSDIIVREDEPSSLIAFALSSEDYKQKLTTFYRKKAGEHTTTSTDIEDDAVSEMYSDIGENGENITERLLESKLVHTTSSHYKYQFTEGTAKMLVKIFYANSLTPCAVNAGSPIVLLSLYPDVSSGTPRVGRQSQYF